MSEKNIRGESGGNGSSVHINAGDTDITVNIRHGGSGNVAASQSSGSSSQADAAERRRRKRNNLISLIIVCVCLLTIFIYFMDYYQITPSTRNRRALSPGTVAESGYYEDKAGWIDDKDTLLKGLAEFHETTGVLPYVYITGSVSGSTSPSRQEIDSFAAQLQSSLFSDGTHMLLVFLRSGSSYMTAYACGAEAALVMDTEAQNILNDCIARYYSGNYTNSEVLANAFTSAAGRMMRVTTSPFIVLLIMSAVAAVVIFLFLRRRKNEQEAEEEQERLETEEMLKIPLQKFGDSSAEELAKKYETKK